MYCDIRLESVENGFILRYTEKRKNGNDEYAMPMMNSKELVYQEDQLDQAVAKIKELRSKKEKKDY